MAVQCLGCGSYSSNGLFCLECEKKQEEQEEQQRVEIKTELDRYKESHYDKSGPAGEYGYSGGDYG